MANWIDDPQNREEVEKVTQELKLPVWKPNYKGKFRDFWNECWDKIEDNFLKLKGSNDSKEPVIKIKQNAFNKPFGVVEDTILEGNKFTQMTGKDFGGILNTPGLKTSGKAYWDNNTRKLYICKNDNNDISPSTNNYIPFDSASLLERLENLIKSITIDNSDFYIRLVYNSLNNVLISGYIRIKREFRINENGLIYNLNNNLSLNGSFVSYFVGMINSKYQRKEISIALDNGRIISTNVSSFTVYTQY